jgi:hypothetical protein
MALLNCFDSNPDEPTVPNAQDLIFSRFDNVRATVVPEPSTIALEGNRAVYLLVLLRGKRQPVEIAIEAGRHDVKFGAFTPLQGVGRV